MNFEHRLVSHNIAGPPLAQEKGFRGLFTWRRHGIRAPPPPKASQRTNKGRLMRKVREELEEKWDKVHPQRSLKTKGIMFKSRKQDKQSNKLAAYQTIYMSQNKTPERRVLRSALNMQTSPPSYHLPKK